MLAKALDLILGNVIEFELVVPLAVARLLSLLDGVQIKEPDLVRPLRKNDGKLPARDDDDVDDLVAGEADYVDQIRFEPDNLFHRVIFAKDES